MNINPTLSFEVNDGLPKQYSAHSPEEDLQTAFNDRSKAELVKTDDLQQHEMMNIAILSNN